MFDFYSQGTQHARLVAYSQPKTVRTWPDAIKESRDADIDARLYRASRENQRLAFAAHLSTRTRGWWLNLLHRPATRAGVHTHYSPAKQDSLVDL